MTFPPLNWLPVERALFSVEQWGSLSEWAEAHVVLPENSPAPGPLDINLTPYGRMPLDCLLYPWTREVTIAAGSQMFKTLLEIVLACWVLKEHPTTMLFLMGREDDAQEIAEDRIKPVLMASPRLRALVKDWHREVKQQEIEVNGARIHFGSANVPAELAQRSIEIGVADETHLYKESIGGEGSPLFLLSKRLSNYPGSKLVKTSTLTDQYSLIWQEYQQGTQHEWTEPCPHCGKYQPLVFARIRRPDAIKDPQELLAELAAWYECPECGAKILESEKPVMLATGKWEPRNQLVENPSHYSFHMSGIASPWRTWSGILAESMRAKGNGEKLRAFFNTTCGENFEEQKNYMARAGIEAAAKLAELPRGVLPNGTIAFTIGCDWHGVKKGLYWIALAWTAGRHLWIVDYGIAKGESQEEAKAILQAETVGREWETKDGVSVRPWVGVDSGEGESADEIYAFCRALYPQVMPTKGDDQALRRVNPVQESRVEYTSAKTGRRHAGFNALHIFTGHYKDALARLIRSAKPPKDADPDGDNTGAKEERGDVHTGGRFHLCRNVEKAFLKSLQSEHKVRAGVTNIRWQWQTRFDGINNHWLDCVVIAMAIADFHGLAARMDHAKAVADGRVVKKAKVQTPDKFQTEDGRAFLVTER